MTTKPSSADQREALRRLLGRPPALVAAPVVGKRGVEGGVTTVRFASSTPGDTWVATALLPDRPSGVGVLYCHAHGNRFDIGMRELWEGRPAFGSPLAMDLVRLGMTVLCVEMPGHGTREVDGTENALAKAALWQGDTLMGWMMRDLARGLDVLSGLETVEPHRIASVGLSMGGTHAYWLAALDDRIAATAHLCVFSDIGPLIQTGAHDLHGAYLTVPGLVGFGDMGAVAALVAPRPQLVCIGADDPLTPETALEPALAKLRAAYGSKADLRVVVEQGVGHRETPNMRKAVVDFLSGL